MCCGVCVCVCVCDVCVCDVCVCVCVMCVWCVCVCGACVTCDVVTGLRLFCKLGCVSVAEEQQNSVPISTRPTHSQSISSKSISLTYKNPQEFLFRFIQTFRCIGVQFNSLYSRWNCVRPFCYRICCTKFCG